MELKSYVTKNDDGAISTIISDSRPKGAMSDEESQEFMIEMLEQSSARIIDATAGLIRITELQDKAILEGLTDAEKEEYKKLKGGE